MLCRGSVDCMLGTLEKGINKLLGLCGVGLTRAQSHYSQRYWSKQHRRFAVFDARIHAIPGSVW